MHCCFMMKAVGVGYKFRNEGVNKENVQGWKISGAAVPVNVEGKNEKKGAQQYKKKTFGKKSVTQSYEI